jgi:hypothetical protein
LFVTQVVKMLLTLVTVFLICWLPIQVFNLTIWWFQELRSPKSRIHYYLYFGLYFSFHLLSQFHTFLNPFIYCYMSNNFNVSLIIIPEQIFRFQNSRSILKTYFKWIFQKYKKVNYKWRLFDKKASKCAKGNRSIFKT